MEADSEASRIKIDKMVGEIFKVNEKNIVQRKYVNVCHRKCVSLILIILLLVYSCPSTREKRMLGTKHITKRCVTSGDLLRTPLPSCYVAGGISGAEFSSALN